MIPIAFNTSVTDLAPVPAIVETMQRQSFSYSAILNSDNELRAFLGSMMKPHGDFDEAHVKHVVRLWEALKKFYAGKLPLPLAQSTSEGNIQLAWDLGQFYLEIEVRRDFGLEWFYRDRVTNDLDGTEDEPDFALSNSLISRLWCICRP
ncbi:MAG: hypothetical protein ACD_28C00116G0002 [uncultured bacterium]|nr:MAG: hypothetical protein ACD_28C00116G0002 [uncultured bacterium]